MIIGGGISAEAYCDSLAHFYSAKDELNAEASDCSGSDGPESVTCKVNTALELKNDPEFNGKPLNLATCVHYMDAGKPMFAIDVNKIVNWTPSNEGISFNCYAYDEKTGKPLKEQDYEFVWTSGSNRIASYYYPFKGVSSKQPVKLPIDARTPERNVEECDTALCQENVPYNNPFVGGYVQGKDGGKVKDAMF